MEVGNLWIIPLSILFNSSLYWVQKHYLVKWFCRKFLSKSVQLECDLKQSQENAKVTALSNGVTSQSNHRTVSDTKIPPQEDSHGKKLVTEGEVNGVAMENVGSVIATLTAIVSVIVMVQTKHDVVNARSPLLIPWCHVGCWYFVVDLYNMYDAFRTKNDISQHSALERYSLFVRFKWPYVVHHVVLFILGYTVVVNDKARGFKGDFFVATIIGEDFSNPFVNSAKVLKMLGRDKTKLYLFNGILLVVVFFVVRILNIPLLMFVYTVQHHNWSITSALSKFLPQCYIAICLHYMLQFYWFGLIVNLALRSLAKMGKQPETQPAVNQKKMD